MDRALNFPIAFQALIGQYTTSVPEKTEGKAERRPIYIDIECLWRLYISKLYRQGNLSIFLVIVIIQNFEVRDSREVKISRKN